MINNKINYLLILKNITYSYGNKKVLFEINFKLKEGEFLSIVGPNGSGKTTLIKIITDLLDIQNGSIKIDGNDHKNIQTKKNLMYLPSDDYLPEFLTGYEYILMMSDLYDEKINENKLQLLIHYYSMKNRIHELIENYSHGMKKKIQLISAFLLSPKLIIIDETLNGLDIESKEVSRLLLENYQECGGTIILCTHDIKLVEELDSRVIILKEGVIKYDSLENEIKTQKISDIFKNFIDLKGIHDEIKKSY